MKRKGLLVSLGEEVRARRLAANDLSQEALAGAAGVSRNVIGLIERGQYNPSLLLIDAVATALDASLVELLQGAAKRT